MSLDDAHVTRHIDDVMVWKRFPYYRTLRERPSVTVRFPWQRASNLVQDVKEKAGVMSRQDRHVTSL